MTGEMKDALEAARRIVGNHHAYRGPENSTTFMEYIEDAEKAARALLSTDKAAVEMAPADLGLILLQCPVALGFEGHDCNGPDCNCGGTILTADAWRYVHSTEKAVGELREALEAIRQYGSDTLSGRTDGPNDRKWQRDAVLELTRRATAALTASRASETGGRDADG